MTVAQESAVLIGGRWTPSLDGQTVPVISPATEEPVAHVTLGGAQDMERAILTAREAFDEGPWPRMSPRERAQVLARASELLMARHDELAETITQEVGTPIKQTMRSRVTNVRDMFDVHVAMAETYPWVEIRDGHALAGRDPPGAGRRRRRDRALERAVLADRGEAGARAPHRLHGRPQARRGDAAQRDRAVRDPHRGRTARGRAERHPRGSRRQRDAREPSRGRQDQLYRQHRRRQGDRVDLRPAAQALQPRAGRQVGGDHPRGRRPRADARAPAPRDHQQQRPGVRQPDAHRRAARPLRRDRRGVHRGLPGAGDRRPDGPGDRHRPADPRPAPRARRGLHQVRARRGRAPDHRRRPPRRPRPRLLRRADDLRRRRQRR